jgi:hypothetical protein
VSVPVPMRKCENKKVKNPFLKSYPSLLPIKSLNSCGSYPFYETIFKLDGY